MTKIFNLYEAKTRLSELVRRAASGEEIVIAKAGKPVARLGPLPGGEETRTPGAWKGKLWVSDDFEEPLPPGIEDAFSGDGD